MKNLISFIAMCAFVLVICLSFVNALDRHFFPGCTVIDQKGKTLVVELDDEYLAGTDTACQRAGEIVLNICNQGYSVRVTNWDGVVPGRVINKTDAQILAGGY